MCHSERQRGIVAYADATTPDPSCNVPFLGMTRGSRAALDVGLHMTGFRAEWGPGPVAACSRTERLSPGSRPEHETC